MPADVWILPFGSLTFLVFGALGACLGSFLNVLTDYPSLRALWRRSRCEGCKRDLRPAELVPVLSYVLLRGACARCGSRIPIHYPIVEAALGLLFVAAGFHALQTPGVASVVVLFRDWLAAFILTLTFVMDARWQEVSPAWLLTGTVLLGASGLFLQMPPTSLILGLVVSGGFFALQFLFSRGRWVGLGDTWVGLFLGALLGFPRVCAALLLAYVAGAVVAAILLARGARKRDARLAFGPFLAAAGMAVLLWGDALLAAYWQMGDQLASRFLP